MTCFVNRPIHVCERVDVESFLIEKLGFINYLLRTSCGKLLDLGIEYYPQLVRMLFANLRTVKNENWTNSVSRMSGEIRQIHPH